LFIDLGARPIIKSEQLLRSFTPHFNDFEANAVPCQFELPLYVATLFPFENFNVVLLNFGVNLGIPSPSSSSSSSSSDFDSESEPDFESELESDFESESEPDFESEPESSEWSLLMIMFKKVELFCNHFFFRIYFC